MNNGVLTPELATKILTMMSGIDEGNETIMTDSFTRFIQTFPEHRRIAEQIYERENARPFRIYEERVSRRGY